MYTKFSSSRNKPRWIRDWKVYCKDNELSCEFDVNNTDHITWVYDGEYENSDRGIFNDDIIEDLASEFGPKDVNENYSKNPFKNLESAFVLSFMRKRMRRNLEAFRVNTDKNHQAYIDNFYDSSKIVNDDEPETHTDETKEIVITENYKRFFKEDSTPYLDKAQHYLEILARELFQGKYDDALYDFIHELLNVSAPGPIKRMVAKAYDVEDTSNSDIGSSREFILDTLSDMHGGKSDDAFAAFAKLLLNNTKPIKVVKFATKWAKEKDVSESDIDGMLAEAGM